MNNHPPQTDTRERLRAQLQAALQPTERQIEDDSAAHAGHAGAREGGHFRLKIRSARFAGLSPLERHRLVYQALGPLPAIGVHALSIDARLPA